MSIFRAGGPAALLLAFVALTACSTRHPEQPAQEEAAGPPSQRGIASYYGAGFHGRRTASGERFDRNAPTAAHPTLPLGTVARVTNLETGRSETVTINDRGPYARGRVVDVSEGVARRLGMRQQGTAEVEVTPIAAPGQSQ